MYRGQKDPQKAWDHIVDLMRVGLEAEPHMTEDWYEWAVDMYECRFRTPITDLKTNHPGLAKHLG